MHRVSGLETSPSPTGCRTEPPTKERWSSSALTLSRDKRSRPPPNGQCRRGHRGERSLTSGCVLVHRAHRLPALIITDDDANNVYSSQFIPIRADQSQLHPAYLWALLTSRSGSESRQRLSLGLTGTIGPSDLANLEIPVPALAEQRRIAVGVQPIIDGLGVRVERPAQSWSKTADLRSGPGWDLLVKFRDISVFNTGTPLGDLAQVRRGDIGRRDFLDRPLPGWFPVIDANSIRDPRATRWAEPDQGTIGPGDIVIPPNPDLDAVAVAATSVAGNNTVVVTANEDRDNMRIVGSLNSATGRDLRRALSVHGVMLRPTDARRIPIYDHPEPAALIEPIGQRLEALLWP